MEYGIKKAPKVNIFKIKEHYIINISTVGRDQQDTIWGLHELPHGCDAQIAILNYGKL
jgi:hypothetical protein